MHAGKLSETARGPSKGVGTAFVRQAKAQWKLIAEQDCEHEQVQGLANLGRAHCCRFFVPGQTGMRESLTSCLRERARIYNPQRD